jgi:drug/metabolite transporter (DMT)-like permease
MTRNSGRWVGFLLILVASILNGLIPSVTQRALLSGMAVETILTSRYFLGSVLIWAYIFIKKKKFLVGKSNVLYMTSLGLLLFLCTTSLNESYKYLPGAVAVIIAFSYVGIVVFLEILMGREKALPRRVVCLMMALVGLAFVVWPAQGIPPLRLLGILLALLGAIFYAMQALGMASKRLEKVEAEVITGYMSLFIFLANFLRCTMVQQPYLPTEWVQVGYIFVLGAGAAFIAPLFYCMSVKKIGASDTSLTNTTEPVFAYLAGILIMADRISWNATVGGILVVSSVFLLNLPGRKEKGGKEEIFIRN